MSKSDIIEYFLHFLSSTMKTNVFAIFFILIINLKICQSANYTDYSLYNVVPVERYQLDFLQNLEKQQYLNAIFWTRPFRMFRDIQILVPREHLNVFKERLGHFHLNATITTSNIEQLFQQQKFKRYTRMKFESFSWNSYYDLESVYQWMTDIATKNSDRVKLKAIGKSAEGREILTLEIVTENPKGKVIVEGAIHGNEWLTTQFVTYLAFFLVYPEKSFNWRLKQVAKKYTWILIPVVNPDGYDYSMKVDRLWRKNRRKTSNATIGVDLNKNFKYRFCEYGGSKDTSSAYYCGPQAFSEPETLAMSKFIHFNRHQLNFYFAFHAYGQKIIIPYSDRVQHIENFAEMENYGKQAILKMYKLYGIKYGIGTIYDVYGYKSSGDSISWVKKTYGVKYSLSFYLRDNGTYGYALPPDNILPACKETLTGLMELMTVRHRSVERELFSSTSNFRSKFYIVSIFITILVSNYHGYFTQIYKMELIYIVCLVFLYINPCTSKSYKNYTLFRGVPVTDHHLEFFKNLSDVYKATFWRSPGLVHRPVEFIIGPNKKRIFLRDAMLKGIYYTTVIEDVQRAFDSQTVKTYVRRNMESFDWTSYFRLDDIYDWLQDLSVMYPKVMHLQNLGKSVEKRDILMAKITLPVRKKRSRPKIIVEGGIHSREWVSIAFVTYFLHQVLTTVDKKESKLKSIAEEYEWYFIPVLNPDGYEYTHKKDRMYRKNMKGVDLNRNFDMHFGSVGTSSRKQDETYGGPKAFSEPETLALANFVKANSKNLKFYLAFHSYGQYMIIPYAYSKKHEGNFDEVHERGIRAAKRISKKYGTQYTVGTAYDTVGYVTSGVSGCWVKKTFSVPYVLTFELRDDGRYGFALPPNQILPTCWETMDGLLSLLDFKTDKMLKHDGNPQKSSQKMIIFDSFMLIWNVFVFIIVRFEYSVVLLICLKSPKMKRYLKIKSINFL
ncbi:uncharacterized protein LOC116773062 [Danaus plexippus]|uniref:uncharacterized protein LOC116773062 n=1 Tax=Danaus plexippus TaxID=13037 RepID=UPI002AAF4C31|nr:uncharacterized protein LOC116773062 [Danaus plexippus]